MISSFARGMNIGRALMLRATLPSCIHVSCGSFIYIRAQVFLILDDDDDDNNNRFV